jgi:cell division protein FtsW
VIYATLGLMMFIAGTKIGFLVLAIVFAIPIAYHYVATHPHASARLLVFLNPEAYKRDLGYQIWESIASFGSGGPFGVGLGAGQQKLHFLPEAHTDFIFSVLGQELGFAGALLTLSLFAILVGRGLWLSAKMPCRFPMFLTFGISTWLGIQALVNMAVALALLPTKGLTLPLVSYGRSSIVVSLIAIGVLLRASAELWSQRPAKSWSRARRARNAGFRRALS